MEQIPHANKDIEINRLKLPIKISSINPKNTPIESTI